MGQENRFLFVKKPCSQAASQTTASKIKSKILNTSSFFKVSLKRNNKDLASALTAERQKSRLLEMEVVDLRKEALALRFDLADKRHTLKNLILICKDLRTSALHQLGRMADLFPSDLDVSEVFDVDKNGLVDAKDDNIQMERILLPQPEPTEDETCPVKQTGVDVPEKNSPGIENVTSDAERRRGGASTLRTELDRFSRLFSEPETGVHPLPCVQGHLIPSVIVSSENPQPPVCTDNDVGRSSSAAMETEPEKTVLLDTAMEMTISDSTEIVAVETKTKKSRQSETVHKMETEEQVVVKTANMEKKKKKQSQVSCGDDGPGRVESTSSELAKIRNPVTLLQTNSLAEEATADSVATENEPLNIQRKPPVSCRIPKLMKLTSCLPEKTKGKKVKSFDPLNASDVPTQSNCNNTELPESDDIFKDPEIQTLEHDRMIFSPERDAAERELFKAKCRKKYSASKTDKLVRKETAARSIDASSERVRKTVSRETKQRNAQQLQLNDESKEKENKLANAAHSTQQLHAESLAHTDDPTEPEDATCPSVFVSKPEANGHSGKALTVSKDDIRRVTYVIPVTGNGLLSGSERQIFLPGSHGNSLTEDLTTVTDVCAVSNPCGRSPETHPAFGRRNDDASGEAPAVWEPARQDTQEPPDIPQTLTSKRMLKAQLFSSLGDSGLVPDHRLLEVTEFQKPKRSRTEKAGRSQKTENVWEPKSHVNDRRRKTSKRSHNTPEFTLFQEHDFDPWSSTDVLSQGGRECVDAIAFQKQKCRETFTIGTLDAPSPSQKQSCTETFTVGTLHAPGASQKQSCRETFTIGTLGDPNGITKESSSFTSITTSNVSAAEAHRHDASWAADGPSLGELLMDEMPPWDALDVSAVTSETDPPVSSPRRTASGRIPVYSEPTSVVRVVASPAGRVMASLTNILLSPDKENRRQPRRCNSAVSYKEPSLNRKMRRGDKFSDTHLLSSPTHKDQSHKKKKKGSKNKPKNS